MNSDRSQQINLIIAEFLEDAESDTPLPRETILARHPEFEYELRAFLLEHDRLFGVADPTVDTPVLIGPQSNDAADLPMPPRLGRYRVLHLLGVGGFGQVYLARDEELQRDVAIKLASQFVSDEHTAAFLVEARTVATLDHPQIVPVYDVGRTDDGGVYVVSKLIDGSDLASRVKDHPLPYARAASLIAMVAEALHYAHEQGVVHRDIKPGNILLDHQGQAHLCDFGLALRSEQYGQGPAFAGTPAYMSPEQARGEGHRVERRSDIYSLGVVLYELLTDRRLFEGMDDRRQRILLAENEEKEEALQSLLAEYDQEINTLAATSEALAKGHEAELAQQRAANATAPQRTAFAVRQVTRVADLLERRAMSQEQAEKTQQDLAIARLQLAETEAAMSALRHGHEIARYAHAERQANLQRERAEAETELRTIQANRAVLEHDVESRVIRAPIAGHIGRIADCPTGATVHAGETLASVVPSAQLWIVAYFPATSIGRLQSGQPAALRLDAYPRTQYGSVPATVAEVGDETQDGWIRVELQPLRDTLGDHALRHGMTATVQATVDTVTPLSLATHLATVHEARGGLLLAYWSLQLPMLGGRLGQLLALYPQYRSTLLRLVEPLGAPEHDQPLHSTRNRPHKTAASGVAISFHD